jgi:hypothetical protein
VGSLCDQKVNDASISNSSHYFVRVAMVPMVCSFIHVMQFNTIHGELDSIKSMDMFRNLRSRHTVINAAFERCMGSLAAYKRS